MNIKEKIQKDEILNLIIKHSQEAEIYAVGGIIRDFFIGKDNYDKDIIVTGVEAEKFAKHLAEKIYATFIPLDEENKIYRLVLKDKITCIDIANPIGKSLEDDIKRRDLTINAIAVNLKTLEIIDFVNGINDLKSKTIRHISEENFIDDPLRLLRAYRFQANLGFEMDKELIKIIEKHATLVKKPAIERINYEIIKLFSGSFCSQTLIDMNKIGMLKELFPVTEKLKTIPPNPHHHLDLFNHSIEVTKQIEIIYDKSSDEVKNHLDRIDFGGATRLAHLKLAGLLHDIGKPSTWTIEEDTGKHRFIKHDDIGAKMAIKMLKSAKYSKKQIDYIAKMIKYHIYPSHVVAAPEISDKIYMRLIRKMENDVIDVITLAMADRLSARGPEITDEVVEKNLNALNALLEFYLNIRDNIKPLPKLLSGEEIMKILNITPSKELGQVIKSLQEAQLAGDITTKEDAVRFITTL